LTLIIQISIISPRHSGRNFTRLMRYVSIFFVRFFMTVFKIAQPKTILVVCLLLFCFTLQVRGASKDVILSKLERARAELFISQATEQRITIDLEELKASGQATPEIINDYEIYLSRVQDMVKENQHLVDTLEAALLKHRGPTQGTSCSKTPQQGSSLPSARVVEEAPDQLGTLDSELNDSLAAFDEMLLKEMEEISEQSEQKMRQLAEEAAAAAQRLKEQGVDPSDSSGESGSDETGGKSPPDQEGTDRKQGEGEAEQGGSYSDVPVTDKRNTKSRSDDDTTRSQRAQEPPESDQDDDIVARQLREAAEKETDPELKKKLWKEYEDYKKGSK
jgi:hypothetical protein